MKTLSLVLFCLYFTAGFSQFKPDSVRLSALYHQALLQQDSAAFFLNEADQLFQKRNQSDRWLETNDYLKARYYILSGKLNEAGALLKETIKRKPVYHPDQAKFYNLIGSVSALQKENDQAINWYKKTLTILDKKNDSVQSAYIKSNIANIFFSSLDYNGAYPYLKEAFRITSATNDTLYGPSIEGMLAVVLLKLNQKKKAYYHAENALDRANKHPNAQALVIANYVLGECWLDRKKIALAAHYFKESLNLASKTGQVYYVMLSNIGLLLVSNEKKEFREAIQYGNQALTIAGSTNNTNTLYSVYKHLGKAFAGNGNPDQAYASLLKAHQLYQEITAARREKTMRELLVKYETQKKENELSKKQLELTRAVNWILVLVFSITLVAAFAFWVRKRNRSRLKVMMLETERLQLEAFVEGEQRERERIAADIHDGIASTLTGLALQLQQVNSLNELPLFTDHLQQVRNEVRLISKNISPFNFKEEGWNYAFLRFLNSVQHPGFSTFFLPEFEESLLNNQRGMVVYRILQELIQNSLKHADASECELVITEEGTELLIQYSDNGKGVAKEELERGNGWQSIQKRLYAIHGKAAFPVNPLGGLKIDITLPKL